MATTSKVKKYTTIDELEKTRIGSVYILNNSKEPMEGRIVLSVPKKNGNGVDLLTVPKTFIPIDAAMQVSRDQLLESAEFRKMVGQGLVKLLNPEYALLLLNTPEGKEEQRRLNNENNMIRTAMQKAGVVSEEPKEDDDEDYVEVEKAGAEMKKKASNKKKPSLKVQNIVEEAKRNDENQVSIITRLRNVKLGKPDLAYLSKTYSDKPRIIKYLKEVLSEIKETEEA